jgi:hypothetical protein
MDFTIQMTNDTRTCLAGNTLRLQQYYGRVGAGRDLDTPAPAWRYHGDLLRI